jgi:hypothetical protein
MGHSLKTPVLARVLAAFRRYFRTIGAGGATAGFSASRTAKIRGFSNRYSHWLTYAVTIDK